MEIKPKILCIETSGTFCSAALFEADTLLFFSESKVERSHAELITILCEEVLQKAGLAWNKLNAIALSAGPGSYTGLRISSSTAKGFCYALQIPLIAVNTLQAMANAVSINENTLICPMIDARRMEVYCSIYNHKNETVSEVEAKILTENSFEEYEKQIIFCGDGAKKCKNVLQKQNIIFLDDILPHACQIGKLAYSKFLKNEFEDIAYFEPHYLKEFIALKKST